jgi:spore maturation protein CgeB
MPLNILYTGPFGGTCEQRANALRSLGHRVVHLKAGQPESFLRWQLYRVGNRLKRPPDLIGANRSILRAVGRDKFDLIWVDKGRTLRPGTLARVRKSAPETVLVSYSPDDMMNPSNQSVQYRRSIPLYDLHVTTKSYNVAELSELGAGDVLFIDNAYDPESHRPLALTSDEFRKFRAGVGFVGQFEEERASMMQRLAENDVRVTVWGSDWDRVRRPSGNLLLREEFLDGVDYAKAINATKINLGFLRKVNRDLQTTRSIEIPACRAFMLAERTDEHLGLFEEGEEAEYFSSFDELLRKCRYYLEHEDERRRIAGNGYRRCVRDGYSNEARLERVIEHVRVKHLPRR